MLRRINNKTVDGPNFRVTIPDIHKVEYQEGDKIAAIEIEGGNNLEDAVDWVVYGQTLRGWMPPHQFDEISAPKQNQILESISEALTLLDMPHRIVR